MSITKTNVGLKNLIGYRVKDVVGGCGSLSDCKDLDFGFKMNCI
jgi:hypothetical protein